MLVHPFVYSDLLFVRTFYDKQYFSGKYVISSFEEMGSTVLLKEDDSSYKEIEMHISGLHQKLGRKINIFNGELMPFNQFSKTVTHKGLPLWSDESVLLYPREKSEILNLTANQVFDVVILHHVPGFAGYNWYDNELKIKLEQFYVLYKDFKLEKYHGQRLTSCWVSKKLLK